MISGLMGPCPLPWCVSLILHTRNKLPRQMGEIINEFCQCWGAVSGCLMVADKIQIRFKTATLGRARLVPQLVGEQIGE